MQTRTLKLTDNLTNVLANLPESGMGYQLVKVILKSGKVLHQPFYSLSSTGSFNSTSATPQPLSPVTGVLIVDDTLAYASYELDGGGGFGGLYISTDAGLTWNFDNASITFFYPDFMTLHKSGNQTIYTGGASSIAQGLIFNKPENVSFWNYDIVDEKINDIASYNDSIVFAVGDSGYIVKNIPLITLLIENNETSRATFTIYPNPTSDVFTIEFDSENTSTKAKELNRNSGCYRKKSVRIRF